jgi:hypothetical protein
VDGVGAGFAGRPHVLGRIEVRRDLDERVRGLGVQRAAIVGAATATVSIPSARHARKMRSAISPRFATSSLRMGPSLGSASPKDSGDSARSALLFLVWPAWEVE